MLQRQFPQRFATNVLTLSLALIALPLCAQERHYDYENPPGGGFWSVSDESDAPPPRTTAHSASNTVSVDVLRYPLSGKVRRLLLKALHFVQIGDHPTAIRQLEDTLAKYPSSAPYAQSLLGVEYLDTHQYPKAVTSLEQAVNFMPHDAINHANLGLALASTGQPDRAEQELHRAIQLDPHIPMAARLLEVLDTGKAYKPASAEPSRPE